ncbi:MAG: hypothetical protein KIS96_10845 [Bauldia sp.]|nr:hypothetical protein [Bauldia sp.]
MSDDDQSWGDTTNPIIAEANNAPLVTGIPSGGSIHDGNEVAFSIPADGVQHWFRTTPPVLAKIIHQLRTFGDAAAGVRAGAKLESLQEILAPYRVRAMPRFGHSADGQSIAMQFPTAEGVPVTIALSRDMAEELARQITAQLANGPPGTRQ